MPMSYKEAVAYAKGLDVKLVPYENEHGMAGTKAAMEQIKKRRKCRSVYRTGGRICAGRD